jgi:hypothetical protein
MVFLILLFFTFVSAGASMTVHRLADSVLSQTRREFSEALTSQSLEDIARIEKISALSMESWNENERYSAARRSEPEHLIGAIVRQFPTPESQYRYEEIFFIALLYYGFPNPRPFSEPKMTEDFKANIDTAAHRFLPESKWGSVKKSLLVPIEKFEVPYANRWILAPSLQNLSRAVRAAPVIEKIFKIFLFSRFYIGTGAENARKTWERIRRIELANVGNDSLGMYPGNAIF